MSFHRKIKRGSKLKIKVWILTCRQQSRNQNTCTKCNNALSATRLKVELSALFLCYVEVESELNTFCGVVTDAQCSMKFVIDIQSLYQLKNALQLKNKANRFGRLKMKTINSVWPAYWADRVKQYNFRLTFSTCIQCVFVQSKFHFMYC